jgi:tetratricopeptide (TPR) repeat protein
VLPEKKTPTLRPAAGVPPPNTPGARAEQSGIERPRSVPPPPPSAMKQTDTNIKTPLGISPYQPAHEPSSPPPRVPHPSARLHTPLPPVRTPPPVRPPERSDRVSLNDLATGLPGTHGIDARPSTEDDNGLDPPTQRRIESGVSAPPEDSASPSRQELYDSIFPHTGRRRRGGLGWIVALVVVVGGVLLAFTVGKPYIAKMFAPEQTSSSAKNDNRLQEALAAGDRARVEGDFTTAREAYLRATVIDDKSMPAWDGYCTAETELAVSYWVGALSTGSSLERDQASSIGAAAGKTCQRWAELSRATDDGAKKAEADLRAAHAVAAQGNVSATRLYVGAHAGDPIVEALVLLADATNNTDETADGGRANDVKSAATALAKSAPSSLATPGDVAIAAYLGAATKDTTRAQACLDELAKRAPRHMLLESLKQLVATGDAGPLPAPSTSASATPSASASTGKVATNETAPKPTGGNTGSTPTSTGGGESPGIPTGDWRDLDKKGHEALAGGDVSKAETMFNGALAQNPGDIDAMYGLGQIARSRGNHAGAMSYFQQVLDHSPGFSPARLALADEQWTSGNQAGAIVNYKIYLESVPTGSGADRARSRIGNVEGTTTPTPP